MTRPLAILCAGQGGQHAGMFELCGESPLAEPVFTAAAQELGTDPRDFIRRAEPPALFANQAAQILCCTHALAAWAVLGDERPSRAVVAGYSVGELAAWSCAGALGVSSTLRLARIRAAGMDAAAPPHSGLAGVVGLTRAMLEPILRLHDTTIAIVNGPDSFVIGGLDDALEASCRAAMASGAVHTVRLPVTAPSHTPLLAAAVAEFHAALLAEEPRSPHDSIRLLSGLDGSSILDIAAGGEKLARQIAAPVQWTACMESCRSAGAEQALEIGPGSALSRMAASYFPEGAVRSSEDFRTVDGLRAWVRRAG